MEKFMDQLLEVPGIVQENSIWSWHIHPKHPLDTTIFGNIQVSLVDFLGE